MNTITRIIFDGFVFMIIIGSANIVAAASYAVPGSDIKIIYDILPRHKYLAEFKRFLGIKEGNKEIVITKLFPDTGGYTKSNLYSCNNETYLLLGYFDSWLIDLKENTIKEGSCTDDKIEYLGVFDGGDQYLMKFYNKKERVEEQLKPRGG